MTAPSASSLLDYYHCTFFLPLLPALGKALPPVPDEFAEYLYGQPDIEAGLKRDEAEAYHFFTPTLRELLFKRTTRENPSGLQPLREWRLPNDVREQWCLTLKAIPPDPPEEGEEPAYAVPDKSVVFDSVRLYQYFNGLILLAYTVKPATGESMALEDWLHFTRLSRQLYPTFTEQRAEKKRAPLVLSNRKPDTDPVTAFDEAMSVVLPELGQPGAAISPIIRELLKGFYRQQSQPLLFKWLNESIALYDDRMFVSVAYGFQGNALLDMAPQDLERIKVLVAFADRFSDTRGFNEQEDKEKKKDKAFDGFPYTKAVIDAYLHDKWMGLWSATGASYVYTDRVNAYLADGWFFKNIVAMKHVLQIYDRMLVQALFYQTSLQHYDHQITEKTTVLLESQTGSSQDRSQALSAIQEQSGAFITFTNQYWFRELTNQMQGKEIFRLQQQGLGLDVYYRQIQDEIQGTNNYLQVQHENRLAKEASDAGNKANRFAQLAVLVGILALLPVINDIFKNEPSLWTSLAGLLNGCYAEDAPDKIGCSFWLPRLTVLYITGLSVFTVYRWCWPFLKKWLSKGKN